jgi:hypothetical protein
MTSLPVVVFDGPGSVAIDEHRVLQARHDVLVQNRGSPLQHFEATPS